MKKFFTFDSISKGVLTNLRIALIGPTYPYRGGISHYTTLLCRNLRKRYDVKFISFKRQYPKIVFPGKTDIDPSDKPLKISDVDYLIDSLNPFTWVKTAKEIVRYSPQKIIFNWWVTFWAPQFLTILKIVKGKIKSEIIIICHNVTEHESNKIKVQLTKLVLSKADKLITHSETETTKCRKILRKDINVVTAFHPTYVDLSSKRYSKIEAKSKLGIKDACILFFGFVRQYKGLSVLLEAMSLIKSKKITLVVAGEFWSNKQKYFEQIKKYDILEQVKIIDEYIPNEDMGLYFAASDIVVQPYLSVSGSGVCQLAYGFERPVIATNVGSLHEVIEDGLNGRLVEAGNPKALADAIVESLEPETLGKFSKNAVNTKENFGWDKLVKLVIQQ